MRLDPYQALVHPKEIRLEIICGMKTLLTGYGGRTGSCSSCYAETVPKASGPMFYDQEDTPDVMGQ
jgi:hypothetical protein